MQRTDLNPWAWQEKFAYSQGIDVQAPERIVVLDSPPCQAASDALMLGRHADGVLFVVKSDATSRRAVKNSLKQLRNAGVTLLGAVINQVDTRRNPHYADTYYYAYGYYG